MIFKQSVVTVLLLIALGETLGSGPGSIRDGGGNDQQAANSHRALLLKEEDEAFWNKMVDVMDSLEEPTMPPSASPIGSTKPTMQPTGSASPIGTTPGSASNMPSSCDNTPLEEAVDLSAWSTTDTNGNWIVSDDNESVLQTINGRPTFFCSDFSVVGNELGGTISVETSFDDDFIGFAFGFQPNDLSNTDSNFLLLDWKQRTQFAIGQTGSAGLALSRVQGALTESEYWGHVGGVEELARGVTLGSIGYADFTDIDFRFVYTPNRLQVYVDEVLQMDITGDFPDGQFCFHNHSQERVRYRGLSRLVFPCDTA